MYRFYPILVFPLWWRKSTRAQNLWSLTS